MEGKGRLAGVIAGLTLVVAVLTLLFGEGIIGGSRGGSGQSTNDQTTAGTQAGQSAESVDDSVPAFYKGSWAGTQVQNDGQRFPVEISLSSGRLNEELGSMSFPTADCQFQLKLTDIASDTSIQLQTRAVAGRTCFDAILQIRSDGRVLAYNSYYRGNMFASGQLART